MQEEREHAREIPSEPRASARAGPDVAYSARSDPRASSGSGAHAASYARSSRSGNYLLTWTTYGTWLPGDARGFVSRVPEHGEHTIHNAVGTPFDRDMPAIARRAHERTAGEPVFLNEAHARVCAESFRGTCARHAVMLRAGAIMRAHVHLVVASPNHDGAALAQLFKGAASRELSLRFGHPPAPRWWTARPSRRLLTSEESLTAAIRYVLGQEDPLLLLGDSWIGDGPRAG